MLASPDKLDKMGQIGIFDAIFCEKRKKRLIFQRFSGEFCQKVEMNETIVSNSILFFQKLIKYKQKLRKMWTKQRKLG